MADFDPAFDRLIDIEGFSSHHPSDRGGETVYGISKRWHPEAWVDGPPTLKTARGFYFTEFWQPLLCDKIKSPAIAFELFEAAVNSGPRDSILWAQKSFNFFHMFAKRLNRVGWPEALVQDGKMGPRTLNALNFMFDNFYSGAQVARQNVLQALHFDELAKERDDQAAFMLGWYNKRLET